MTKLMLKKIKKNKEAQKNRNEKERKEESLS